jgi:hypothetical protein
VYERQGAEWRRTLAISRLSRDEVDRLLRQWRKQGRFQDGGRYKIEVVKRKERLPKGNLS